VRGSRLVATLIALPAIVILIGLGIWQLDRLAWKQDLIETMERRMAESPHELGDIMALPADDRAWRPVMVVGRYLNDREMPLYRQSIEDGEPGYQILTPLVLANGRAVLVNRGWVPEAKRDAATRTGAPQGQVWVTGIVRDIGARAPFAVDNSPATGEWYWIDHDAMQDYAGVDLLPFVVVADRAGDPNVLPRGGQIRLDLPNDHLQYALTWFALAVALAVIYGLWMRRGPHKKGRP
jgi:surfeit locus 1 family protein